jgi:replicative DNA helicase
MARLGVPAVLFALEMTPDQIAERYLAAATNIEANRISSASFTAEEAYKLAEAPAIYRDRPRPSLRKRNVLRER